jgi:hypothetical protein
MRLRAGWVAARSFRETICFTICSDRTQHGFCRLVLLTGNLLREFSNLLVIELLDRFWGGGEFGAAEVFLCWPSAIPPASRQARSAITEILIFMFEPL